MKLFLWTHLQHEYSDGCCSGVSTHACVIVAAHLDDARAQWHEDVCLSSSLLSLVPCGELPLPDRTYEVDPYSKEEVLILGGDD